MSRISQRIILKNAVALILALSLTGCERARERSLAATYNEVQQLIRVEQDRVASAKTDRVLQGMKPGSVWYPRFRLLRVEILLARREGKQAEEALNFQVPSGPEWIRERARYELYQGYAAYLLQKYDAARERLRDAETLAQSAGDARLTAEIALRQGILAVTKKEFIDAGDKFQRTLDYALRNSDAYLDMCRFWLPGTGKISSWLPISLWISRAPPLLPAKRGWHIWFVAHVPASNCRWDLR